MFSDEDAVFKLQEQNEKIPGAGSWKRYRDTAPVFVHPQRKGRLSKETARGARMCQDTFFLQSPS